MYIFASWPSVLNENETDTDKDSMAYLLFITLNSPLFILSQ